MPLTPEMAELAERVRRWGRWGDDDEVGSLNLVDDEAARRGAAAVRTGRCFGLAVPLGPGSPQKGGAPRRFNPIHTMLSLHATYVPGAGEAAFNDDMVVLPLSAGTHVDALAHVGYDGRIWNGYPIEVVTSEGGATRCGADSLRPVVSRGVLLDLPAALGVERLEPGHAIGPDDLDAALDHARVRLAPGDVLLVRTGQMQLLHAGEVWAYNHDTPGLSVASLEWIHRHEPGLVFTDTYVYEVWPPEDWSAIMAVHMISLRDMGQLQGQNADLEALAEACADDGVYDCLVSVAPEPVTGGCSAPVQPVAVR